MLIPILLLSYYYPIITVLLFYFYPILFYVSLNSDDITILFFLFYDFNLT